VLDRKVGDYELPKGWSIVAAGNRENDRGVVYRMPPPLANRFVHFEMEVDFEDWKAWAYRANIDASIIAFLQYDPTQLFNFDPTTNQKSFATPRSWEFAHKILQSGIEKELLHESLSGAVGEKSAVAYLGFKKVMHALPDIDEVLSGEITRIESEDIGFMMALSIGIVNRLKTHSTPAQIDTLLTFSMGLPSEYAIMLIKDMQLNGIEVQSSPNWGRWVEKFAYLLS